MYRKIFKQTRSAKIMLVNYSNDEIDWIIMLPWNTTNGIELATDKELVYKNYTYWYDKYNNSGDDIYKNHIMTANNIHLTPNYATLLATISNTTIEIYYNKLNKTTRKILGLTH